jgi:hypothetical protein
MDDGMKNVKGARGINRQKEITVDAHGEFVKESIVRRFDAKRGINC